MPRISNAARAAVCAVTGWHRDHARKAIRLALAGRQPNGPRRRREPVRVYDDAAVELLVCCWAVLDGPTGKRLRPGLPDLIANLSRLVHLAPGDLIMTGTPENVAAVGKGDLLEGVIEGVGTVSVRIA